MKARREAMLADVVVVNHHLFFADMALRDSGVAELLPSVEVAIFDEAHQLAEAGVQFLGTTLGSAQLIDFARDMLAVGLQQARGLAPWQELAAACDHAARELRMVAQGEIGEVRGSLKLRWAERSGAAALPRGADARGADACEAARSRARHGERDRAGFRPPARARAPPRPARRPLRRAAAGRPDPLDRPARAPGAPGRVAARHPRSAARADGEEREGVDLHLGDARRRRAAELVHRARRARRCARRPTRQPVRLPRERAGLRPARSFRSRATPAMPTRSRGSRRAARARSAAAPSC